ncbi:hypothetical protein P154DRAFT_537262 [Amniculicola lignicola CBS 123094]|uniref:Uncharacterized protein n=1 Tax=Amniculicola lignicola CBS 123094 TaxID=1392246 RepID=A0A6A5WDQ1_9PLEO|nr:hypothetical protein P154DRAFT_537262 [Amniculicola lignicola CBS 123094]
MDSVDEVSQAVQTLNGKKRGSRTFGVEAFCNKRSKRETYRKEQRLSKVSTDVAAFEEKGRFSPAAFETLSTSSASNNSVASAISSDAGHPYTGRPPESLPFDAEQQDHKPQSRVDISQDHFRNVLGEQAVQEATGSVVADEEGFTDMYEEQRIARYPRRNSFSRSMIPSSVLEKDKTSKRLLSVGSYGNPRSLESFLKTPGVVKESTQSWIQDIVHDTDAFHVDLKARNRQRNRRWKWAWLLDEEDQISNPAPWNIPDEGKKDLCLLPAPAIAVALTIHVPELSPKTIQCEPPATPICNSSEASIPKQHIRRTRRASFDLPFGGSDDKPDSGSGLQEPSQHMAEHNATLSDFNGPNSEKDGEDYADELDIDPEAAGMPDLAGENNEVAECSKSVDFQDEGEGLASPPTVRLPSPAPKVQLPRQGFRQVPEVHKVAKVISAPKLQSWADMVSEESDVDDPFIIQPEPATAKEEETSTVALKSNDDTNLASSTALGQEDKTFSSLDTGMPDFGFGKGIESSEQVFPSSVEKPHVADNFQAPSPKEVIEEEVVADSTSLGLTDDSTLSERGPSDLDVDNTGPSAPVEDQVAGSSTGDEPTNDTVNCEPAQSAGKEDISITESSDPQQNHEAVTFAATQETGGLNHGDESDSRCNDRTNGGVEDQISSPEGHTLEEIDAMVSTIGEQILEQDKGISGLENLIMTLAIFISNYTGQPLSEEALLLQQFLAANASHTNAVATDPGVEETTVINTLPVDQEANRANQTASVLGGEEAPPAANLPAGDPAHEVENESAEVGEVSGLLRSGVLHTFNEESPNALGENESAANVVMPSDVLSFAGTLRSECSSLEGAHELFLTNPQAATSAILRNRPLVQQWMNEIDLDYEVSTPNVGSTTTALVNN